MNDEEDIQSIEDTTPTRIEFNLLRWEGSTCLETCTNCGKKFYLEESDLYGECLSCQNSTNLGE